MKKCSLVLGMHRSGTSVFAGCLSLLGLDVSGNLLPASSSNEKGHFENHNICALNDDILFNLNSSWDIPPEQSNIEFTDSMLSKYSQRVEEIIESDFVEDSSRIVIKDPRITLFPNFWIDILTKLEYEVSVFFCIRDPIEICTSLYQRNKFSYEKSSKLYLHYIDALLQFQDGADIIYVEYDKLLDLKYEYLKLILDDSFFPSQNMCSIEKFITPELNHQRERSHSKLVMPVFLNELYTLLNQRKWIELVDFIEILKSSDWSFKDELLNLTMLSDSVCQESLVKKNQVLEQEDSSKIKEVEKEYFDLRSSWSCRLGFVLTFPFRKIYNFFF